MRVPGTNATLCEDLLRHVATITVPPAGVCRAWDVERRRWRTRAASRVQRAYRVRRARYLVASEADDPVHAMMLRMYMVDYPFEYLQRWPDLAARKCPGLTTEHRAALAQLPTAEARTRRHVRSIMARLTVDQIMYVGW